MFQRIHFILFLVFGLGACQVPDAYIHTSCADDAECGAGRCVDFVCVPDGAGADGGTKFTRVESCDPHAPNEFLRDSDCDGLSDGEELQMVFGGTRTADACHPDSDQDGIMDGTELGRTSSADVACAAKFIADVDLASKTDPTLADTDQDGLGDGAEDLNGNGAIDPGESDPLKPDSDCDGLTDLVERSGLYGCATDPLAVDSDADGLPDLVEVGMAAPPAPAVGCDAAPVWGDADPLTKTSACDADSDKDGIQDGAEDLNQNGRVDPGELNPNLSADGSGAAQAACATQNLRKVAFHVAGAADLTLALTDEFAVQEVTDPAGNTAGLSFTAPGLKIAGIALALPPSGSSGVDEELRVRNVLAGLGFLSAPITQTFTTWDGFPGSVRATYDQDGFEDASLRISLIAQAFLGAGAGGLPTQALGAPGPFKLQAELIRRSDKRAVILVALTPASHWSGQTLFRLDDVAGGSAVAQFKDTSAVACEVFQTKGNPKVDFVWVVDDSCSMANFQAAVGNAGSAFGQRLSGAGLDWRVGAVTTGYYALPQSYRPFTTSVATMQSWFTQFSATWFGTSGVGYEQSLESARLYLQGVLLPRTTSQTVNQLRQGADLHLIMLGDADDQTFNTPASAYSQFFNNFDFAGSKAVVHGIVCPQGQNCGETQGYPRRNLEVINQTGGVLGDINVAQSGSAQLAATLDAILSVAISGTGHAVAQPPIASSIKVAMDPGSTVGACNTQDVPRDRQNGFDFDATSNRIVLLGSCLPKAPNTRVAVSYRYWIDRSSDPDGDPCNGGCGPELQCNPQTATCECRIDCGGCAAGLVCNTNLCACEVTIN